MGRGIETKEISAPPQSSLRKGLKTAAVLLIAAFYVFCAKQTGFSFRLLWEGIPSFLKLMKDMTPPNWSIYPRIIPAFIETIQIAVLGTTAGAVLAIPLIALSSNNINTNKISYFIFKALMNLIRTIPELLYAAVLVSAVGFGPFGGVLALAVFSLAIIAKLTSESVEAIDPGPPEALAACGATKAENIMYAVVPQVLPVYVSYFLYVLEINIRVSTVLGLVGAGGIGQLLKTYLDLFRYQNASTVIIATFLLVVIIDQLSVRLRARLI
ncbi:MAG TPA: phosphonate ABC transporter, permease protein PhnE [Firmicutes bacterium]|nr:phosphonate ABC transporter, permease protein PhnE [Bacillota bacterium]